jgi:hypothetical protein
LRRKRRRRRRTLQNLEVQEPGTEILEMILEQVFGTEDVEPVDIDRGACEESGAEG